jgi:hypothetical protein
MAAPPETPGPVQGARERGRNVTVSPSKAQILLARAVAVSIVALAILGPLLHGVSLDELRRLWQNLLDRPGGPMTFRFVLQPVMVTIAAVRDGLRDARNGRSPYLWTMLTQPAKVQGRLNEGLIATARIILLGLGMDLVYQAIVFETFHPAEAVLIAILLAFVPYLLLRGPVTRIARWWRRDARPQEGR